MGFLNIPIKAISCNVTDVIGVQTMPWYNPADFPVQPGSPAPTPIERDYRWRITLDISEQLQSSSYTRNPGQYNGIDVNVGLWIANSQTGQAWQIISVESKTELNATVIVQDVYRYNTFRDPTQNGNGGPDLGVYVIFSVSEAGVPSVDPVPVSGVSSQFGINLLSRFEYINLQYDYPLYQAGNNFQVNDVVAVDSVTNSFVLSDVNNRLVAGRVTSISDTIPGWFTINPVQKIVDNLDYLPGNIGSIIYTSLDNPGELTTDPGGTQIYLKLRNNTQSVTYSTSEGPTTANNVFQLNGVDVTVLAPGDKQALVDAVNLTSLTTGVVASIVPLPTINETNPAQISSTYGEPVLWASSSPAQATINGVLVTFNITSTDPGYTDYARPAQMAQAINNAAITNIVAYTTENGTKLAVEHQTGGSITIVNISNDVNNVPFAGANSGSGLNLSTPASSLTRVRLLANDSRAINMLNVTGIPLDDFGLVSVENGVKACALYIEEGLRTTTNVVVANLPAMYSLDPLIGDQAYVIDSDDGQGNNVGEWSLWLFDGVNWIETANQDSATTDAKSLTLDIATNATGVYQIGQISTGRRVTLITVQVIEPYNAAATLNIGYEVNSVPPSPPVYDGLMTSTVIDLTVAGTYTTSTDVLFGIDTDQGDVSILADFVLAGATQGQAQIIVSYV